MRAVKNMKKNELERVGGIRALDLVPYPSSWNSRVPLYGELDRERRRFSPDSHVPVVIMPVLYNTGQCDECLWRIQLLFFSICDALPSCLIRTVKIRFAQCVRFRRIARIDVTIMTVCLASLTQHVGIDIKKHVSVIRSSYRMI